MMAESSKRENPKKTESIWPFLDLVVVVPGFMFTVLFVMEVLRSSLRFKCRGHRQHFSNGGFPTMNNTKFKGDDMTTYNFKNGYYLLRNDSSKPLSCF